MGKIRIKMNALKITEIDSIKSPDEAFYEKEVPAKEEQKHSNTFYGARRIYREDGWLSPKGTFWGCEGDEHDTCAKYIVKTHLPKAWKKREEALGNINSEESISPRRILEENGYAQLSGRRILKGKRLTERQRNSLNEASIRIQTSVELDEEDMKFFKEVYLALKTGALSNEEAYLVERFFENDNFWDDDNAEKQAEKLFEALTIGFPQKAKRIRKFDLYWETDEYRYYPDADFAVYLLQHRHDGQSGLQWTSFIKIVPMEEMLDVLESTEWSDRDFLEFWEKGAGKTTYPKGYGHLKSD